MIHGREVTSDAGANRVYVDVRNDQFRVSQRGRDGQLLQMRFNQFSRDSCFREKLSDLCIKMSKPPPWA